MHVVPGRRRFLLKGVNRKEKSPFGEHTPCTLNNFKAGKKTLLDERKRSERRGDVLPNNLCHRFGPGFASTAGKQRWAFDELFSGFRRISDGFCILKQNWFNGIYLWWHLLHQPCGHPVWPYNTEAFCDRNHNFYLFQKCNIIAETFHSNGLFGSVLVFLFSCVS